MNKRIVEVLQIFHIIQNEVNSAAPFMKLFLFHTYLSFTDSTVVLKSSFRVGRTQKSQSSSFQGS